MNTKTNLKPTEKVMIKKIVGLVSDQTYIPVKDILGKSRCTDFVDARHMCYYFAYKQMKLPVTAIARHFNVTHGAVIHALRNMGYRLILNEANQLRRLMDNVAEELECGELMKEV